MTNGKFVLCVVEDTPEGPLERVTPRELCLSKPKEACHSCPNSRFVVRFQAQVGRQQVLCPRWASPQDERQGRDPLDYSVVQRDTCLLTRPFSFCSACPNAKADEPPRVTPRWYEEEERMKRLEREMDEEARD